MVYSLPKLSRNIRSDGEVVNPSDGINDDGSLNVIIKSSDVNLGSGSSSKTYNRLAAEAKPSTGLIDGDSLLIVDTGDVYVYYSGIWRPI